MMLLACCGTCGNCPKAITIINGFGLGVVAHGCVQCFFFIAESVVKRKNENSFRQ